MKIIINPVKNDFFKLNLLALGIVGLLLTTDVYSIDFDNEIVDGTTTQTNAVGTTFTNNLTVNGFWNLNSTGNNTDMFFNGAQTLGGTGQIVLSDFSTNRIFSSENNLLTIGNDLTIRGAGQLGVNQTTFDNKGTVLAQGTNATLTIDSSLFTNNGVLRAEGANGLVITTSRLDNKTSVDVNSGSRLSLIRSAVNGIFNIAAGGSATARSSSFDNATINGVMQQNNGTSNTFTNGLTLNGTWNQNSSGNNTDMRFSGSQTIDGNGEVVMTDSANNRILSRGNNTITVGKDITIRGAGQLGDNQTTFDNKGTILAQGSTVALTIDSNLFTNNGVLRAESSQGLVITSTTLDNKTSVDVNNGSRLRLMSSTVNGVFNNTLGGTATAISTIFDAATINGVMQQNNGVDNTFINGLTVNGTWNLNSSGNNTDMFFNGAQTIGGNGEIVMTDSIQNRIFSNGINTLTVGKGVTIRGAGQLGVTQTSFVNKGSITADGVNLLAIETVGTGLDNQGNLNATGNGGIRLTGKFTTSGNVNITANSKIYRPRGTFVQTAGQTNVNGTLTSLVDIQGGLLSGSGLINGNVNNSGTVGPGNSPGLFSINGDYTQTISGLLDIELGGLVPGSEYDVLDISGDAFLDGFLEVSFFDSFNPMIGYSFDILIADNITGIFDFDTSSLGFLWQIDYLIDALGRDDVVRLTVLDSLITPEPGSDPVSVPTPPTILLLSFGLISLIRASRHKNMATS